MHNPGIRNQESEFAVQKSNIVNYKLEIKVQNLRNYKYEFKSHKSESINATSYFRNPKSTIMIQKSQVENKTNESTNQK